ncbi:helix-turn-helix domain-containing protein [Streptomyces adustus]|uniref:helix-turn-helix domain-containing protein n=1 Tax=Streptomyces adustus TaxID=1609272 RepID=UPI00371D7F8F
MEQGAGKDFNTLVAQRVGRQIARAREGVGGRRMTAQALANRTAELGHPLDRSVIAKLEKGFRQTVTVADVLVLARALDVPPVALLFPLDEPQVELLPGEISSMWPALQWFGAEGPYPLPSGSDAEPQRWDPPPSIALFRQHEDFVRQCQQAAARAAESRLQSTLADDDDRARWEASAEADAQLALSLRDTIKALRKTLRAANHEPPPLPKALRSLDDDVK